MILALSMGDLRTFSLPVLPEFRRGFYFSDLRFRLAQRLRQLGKNAAMRCASSRVSSSRRNRRRGVFF
jgi:hypothetical protein